MHSYTKQKKHTHIFFSLWKENAKYRNERQPEPIQMTIDELIFSLMLKQFENLIEYFQSVESVLYKQADFVELLKQNANSICFFINIA